MIANVEAQFAPRGRGGAERAAADDGAGGPDVRRAGRSSRRRAPGSASSSTWGAGRCDSGGQGNPPLYGTLHEAAQAARPAEMFTTCYVDRDPEVVATVPAHGRGARGGGRGSGPHRPGDCARQRGGVGRPRLVPARVRDHVDGVHFMPAGQAQAVARGSTLAAFPSGSRLVIAAGPHPVTGAVRRRIAAAYAAGRILWTTGLR